MNIEQIKQQVGKKYSRALVTGGAGFIGSHIVEELLSCGIDVVSVDDFIAGKQRNIQPFMDNPHFKSVKCDITDFDEFKKAFDGVDVVFHEAASKKNVCLIDPRRDLQVNGAGAFNVMQLCLDCGVKRVLHASTGSVYGEAQILPQDENHPLLPVSYYGVSKLAGESYAKTFAHLYGLNATVLRYFHVYGPRQESGEFGGVIAIFIRHILENKNPVIFGDGTQERSFTYVKDVVNANLLLSVTDGIKGEAYNCASGINVTVGELCDMLLDAFGKREQLPAIYKDWLVGDIKKFEISNAKLRSLGFEFLTDFKKGLKETAEDYIKMYNAGELK